MVNQTGHPYESVFAIPNDTRCKVSHCEFLCNECGISVEDLSFNAIARGEYREIDGIVHRRFDIGRPAEICRCIDRIWLIDGNVPYAITFGPVSEQATVPVRQEEEGTW